MEGQEWSGNPYRAAFLERKRGCVGALSWRLKGKFYGSQDGPEAPGDVPGPCRGKGRSLPVSRFLDSNSSFSSDHGSGPRCLRQTRLNISSHRRVGSLQRIPREGGHFTSHSWPFWVAICHAPVPLTSWVRSLRRPCSHVEPYPRD